MSLNEYLDVCDELPTFLSASINMKNVYFDDEREGDDVVKRFFSAKKNDCHPEYHYHNNVLYFPQTRSVFETKHGFFPCEDGQATFLKNINFDICYCRGFYGIVQGSNWIDNYYHFLVKSVGSALLLHKNFPEITIVANKHLAFQNEYFDILREYMPVKFCNPQSSVLFEKAVYPSTAYGYALPSQVYPLFNTYFSSIPSNGKFEKIYISRQKANVRRILNEDEVIEVVSKHGFTVVQLEALPVKSQISIFKSAKFIIAPHGAGLSNLLFSQNGIRLIEIFNRGYLNQAFLPIVLNKKIKYQAIVSTTHMLHDQSFRVNPKTLEEIIHKEIYENHFTQYAKMQLNDIKNGVHTSINQFLCKNNSDLHGNHFFMETHHYREALNNFQRTLPIRSPETTLQADWLHQALRVYERMAKYTDAVALMKTRIDICAPIFSEKVYNTYMSILLKIFDFITIQTLVAAFAEHNESLQSWAKFQYAQTFEAKGQLGNAIKCMLQVVRDQPEIVERRVYLSNLLRKALRHEEAVALAEERLAVQPSWYEGYRQLSFSYDFRGEIDNAINMAQKSVEVGSRQAVWLRTHPCNLLRKKYDFEGATRLVLEGLSINPCWGEGHKQLSLIAEAQSDLGGAIEHARRAVKFEGFNLGYRAHLAHLLRKIWKSADAETVICEGLKINEFWGDGHIQLSHNQETMGDISSAIESAQRALQIDQYNQHFRCRLGHLLRRQGDFVSAESLARDGLALNPYWGEGYRQLSFIEDACGRLDSAIQLALKAVELEPHTVWFRTHPANLLRKKGDFGAAIEVMTAAMELNPYWSEPHAQFSFIHDAKGEIDEAIACARKATEVEPYNLGRKAHLSNLLRKKKDFSAAVDLMTAVMEFNPYWSEPHAQFSFIHDAKGEIDEAIACARKATEVEPYHLGRKAHLTNLLRKKKDFSAAIEVMDAAMELNPHWSEPHAQFSFIHDAKREIDEAIACARKATEVEPYHLGRKTHLAYLLRKKRDFPEAIRYMAEQLSVNPYWSEPYIQFSYILKDTGKLDEAIECVRHAIKLDPCNSGHKAYLCNLLNS